MYGRLQIDEPEVYAWYGIGLGLVSAGYLGLVEVRFFFLSLMADFRPAGS